MFSLLETGPLNPPCKVLRLYNNDEDERRERTKDFPGPPLISHRT